MLFLVGCPNREVDADSNFWPGRAACVLKALSCKSFKNTSGLMSLMLPSIVEFQAAAASLLLQCELTVVPSNG